MTSQAIAADTEIEREPFGARRVLGQLRGHERVNFLLSPGNRHRAETDALRELAGPL
jgi:hypothetical protein